ncbi:enolase C-terminal domain-like protein, partial [Halorubrum lacusprofundi]|uniref:enolase C-terminal domain-like protein n=1 Tax=Halorubrum lacusprofundi TaxID=2247 RepID=UPI002412318F
RRVYDGNVQIGRTGLFLRAISTVDITRWDVQGKAAGTTLHKRLRGRAEAVPSYGSGGYYRGEKGHEALRGERRRYLDEGHDIVKMKGGRLSAAEEVERVAAVRDEIGDERTIRVDANGVWGSSTEALRNCRAFEPYDPYFREEPVMSDRVETMAEVNDGIEYPV